MKNLSVLVLGFLVVACNGTGGGTASVEPANLSAQEKYTLFESNYKASAELLEDSSVFRYNPCRDDLNWQSTGANSGTIEISGYTYSTNNVVSIQRNGDCDVDMNVHSPFGNLQPHAYFDATNSPLELNGDYTAILINQAGTLYLDSDNTTTRPFVAQTEAAALAGFYIKEANNLLGLYDSKYSRVMRADVATSTSYAMFEVDRTANDVEITHYNSVAGGSLPIEHIRSAGFDENIHSPMIEDFSLDHIRMTITNGYSGPLGMIIFDRKLTTEEKSLIGCYALYLSAKQGDFSLWNANHAQVCNL